jgi:hypothetical protein
MTDFQRSRRRASFAWNRDSLGLGTGAVAFALVILTVLAPATSGALVRGTTTISAPYLHTQNSGGKGTQVNGCAKASAPTPYWHALTGGITEFTSASARTCGKSVGVGGSGQGYADTEISVAIPIRITSPGSHSVSANVTVKLATVDAFTIGGCPAKNVPSPAKPNQYSFGICEAAAYISWSTSAYLVDENNVSWYGTSAYGYDQNDSYWQNYTDCYNFGTPACTNITGTVWGASGSGIYSTNIVGFSGFTWNGTNTWTMWANGTNMVRNHHYVLVFGIGMSVTVFASAYNLLGFWAGTAGATINMGTLGNGANLRSVTVS